MKNKAILSLVFGICGIVLSAVPFLGFVTTILSIVGIVFAAKCLKSGDQSIKGLSIAALICCILGVLGGLPVSICTACTTCAVCSSGGLAGLEGLEGMM